MSMYHICKKKKDASIIIPCRNEGEYLKITVDSLLSSKNHLNYEIIVVNDGSCDGCCDFLVESKYRKIRKIDSQNLGIESSKMLGATGGHFPGMAGDKDLGVASVKSLGVAGTKDLGMASVKSFGVAGAKNLGMASVKSLGVAGAKNLGAREACSEYLFFCDAHILVQDFWVDHLVNSMNIYNANAICPGIKGMFTQTVGYGETWDEQLNCYWCQVFDSNVDKNDVQESEIYESKIYENEANEKQGYENEANQKKAYENKVHEIPIAPGGFFGISKTIFDKIGGFENNFRIWGREDEEISLRLWLFGYKIIVDGNIEIEHLFKMKNAYGVTSYEAMYNLLFMAFLHFEAENLIKVIQFLKSQLQFSPCLSELLLNRELINKRKYYLDNRIYNEGYFFDKFNIKLEFM